MVLNRIYIVLLFPLVFSCSSNNSSPYLDKGDGGSGKQEVIGKELYESNCASCHGPDGKLGMSGAKDLSISTMSELEVIEIIEKGKKGMPSMKGALGSEQNVRDVAQYVLTLRK